VSKGERVDKVGLEKREKKRQFRSRGKRSHSARLIPKKEVTVYAAVGANRASEKRRRGSAAVVRWVVLMSEGAKRRLLNRKKKESSSFSAFGSLSLLRRGKKKAVPNSGGGENGFFRRRKQLPILLSKVAGTGVWGKRKATIFPTGSVRSTIEGGSVH